MTDSEIQREIEIALDNAEAIWKKVGFQFPFEKANMYSVLEESVKTHIPGYPFIEDGKPKVDDYIALVLDIRQSTKHLSVAIKAKASQLERVLYETTAINTLGLLVVSEYKGGITEFLGDGFLALFRVIDTNNPDEVYLAYNSAKKCIVTINSIVNNILYKRYSLPPIKVGIGLAFSRALVTLVGLGDNLHPKVIGECVFRASKISKGINEIYVDHRLKCLWPKKRGGKLEFVLRKTKDDFRSFEILMKS